MDFLSGYESEEANGLEEVEEELEKEGGGPLSLLKCMVCHIHPKAYKCPRCHILSCSLICCKVHKVSSGCSGQRDRTEYLPIKEFKESNLRNDYHFLEDVLQTKRRAKGLFSREKPSRVNNNVSASSSSDLMSHTKAYGAQHTPAVKKLTKAALARNINLLVLSPGMTKRKVNTTYYQQNVDTCFWRVHIVFVTTSTFDIPDLFRVDPLDDRNEHFTIKGSLIEVCFPQVKESLRICDLLDDIFEPKPVRNIFCFSLKFYAFCCFTIYCLLFFAVSSSFVNSLSIVVGQFNTTTRGARSQNDFA